MSDNATNSIAKKGAGKAEKYTAQQVIDALRTTKGMVSLAAKKLQCDPATVYRYIRTYPTVAAAVRSEREAMTDIAELALYKAIQGGVGWAVCFYLKTQGKERGYVERKEISGPDGGPIQMDMVARALEKAYGDGNE